MARDKALKVSVGIIAAIMVCIAARDANDVFAPLTLALFIIALVWPMQSWLQARMPALLALAITMTVTIAVCLAFASLVVWGFGRVGVSVMADSALDQARRAEQEIFRGKYRGPLHGIPVGLKDLIDTAGVRTTAASELFKKCKSIGISKDRVVK